MQRQHKFCAPLRRLIDPRSHGRRGLTTRSAKRALVVTTATSYAATIAYNFAARIGVTDVPHHDQMDHFG
jgi:hypothetical protein